MAHAGCPLLGDQKYGNEESVNYSKEHCIKNVALKAVSLEFIHPKTGKTMSFSLD
jgi:23S rRNA pseudouridine1911/1915/1917 synthase